MTPGVAVLSDGERFDWLRLSRSDGIGPRTFLGLIRRFGSAAAAIDAVPSLARRRPGVTLAPPDAVLRELQAGTKRGLRYLGLYEPDYPPDLRAIDAAPPMLAVAGDPAVLRRDLVAIVGARNASGPGLVFTERLAAELGRAGVVVVSGLARGIDGQAHRATLATGTVAVLAGGHDRIYPREHADLARRIEDSGAVVSELPLGWEPRSQDFPRRNRIVAGLARATVVVEAAQRSGSLITARLANEQGRDVFAVPGSPLDPRAEGTNELLRQGASLCTRADDVLEALAARRDAAGSSEPRRRLVWSEMADAEPDDDSLDPPDADANATLLGLLGPAPLALDDLVRLTGLGAAQVRTALFDLELDGQVTLASGLATRRMA